MEVLGPCSPGSGRRPDHEGQKLNYFVYPYVEVDRRADGVPVEKFFSYQDG